MQRSSRPQLARLSLLVNVSHYAWDLQMQSIHHYKKEVHIMCTVNIMLCVCCSYITRAQPMVLESLQDLRFFIFADPNRPVHGLPYRHLDVEVFLQGFACHIKGRHDLSLFHQLRLLVNWFRSFSLLSIRNHPSKNILGAKVPADYHKAFCKTKMNKSNIYIYI